MEIKSSKTLVEETLKNVETIDPLKTKKLNDEQKCILIDIKAIRELWNEGTIENVIHVPRGTFEFWLYPLSPYFKKEKI